MNHQRYDASKDLPPAHSRYLTLGGAAVVMRPDTEYKQFTWRCEGCQEQSFSAGETRTRREANAHAGACRSMPAG